MLSLLFSFISKFCSLKFLIQTTLVDTTGQLLPCKLRKYLTVFMRKQLETLPHYFGVNFSSLVHIYLQQYHFQCLIALTRILTRVQFYHKKLFHIYQQQNAEDKYSLVNNQLFISSALFLVLSLYMHRIFIILTCPNLIRQLFSPFIVLSPCQTKCRDYLSLTKVKGLPENFDVIHVPSSRIQDTPINKRLYGS